MKFIERKGNLMRRWDFIVVIYINLSFSISEKYFKKYLIRKEIYFQNV